MLCDGNSLVLFCTGKAGDDEGSYDPRDGAAKVRLQNLTRIYFIRTFVTREIRRLLIVGKSSKIRDKHFSTVA